MGYNFSFPPLFCLCYKHISSRLTRVNGIEYNVKVAAFIWRTLCKAEIMYFRGILNCQYNAIFRPVKPVDLPFVATFCKRK